MITRSDTEIWSLIVAADKKAWRELVDRYTGLVFTIGLRCGLSEQEAHDCHQHTWLSLYENRSHIANPEAIRGWLATTARREALRLGRRRDRQDGDVNQADAPDPNPLPDEELEMLQRQAVLEMALQSVGGRCEKILYALFFEPREMSYAEISKKLGIPANSLGPNRTRCLDKLKKQLTAMEIDQHEL